MKENKLQKFILAGQKIHLSCYEYNSFIYVNNRTKGIIICKIHGQFEQTPDKHINGKQGCPKCGYLKSSKTQSKGLHEFISEAHRTHKNGDNPIYSYEKFKYVNNHKKGVIVCSKHGDFEQTPANHVFNKTGCHECNGNRKRTISTFISDSQNIHKDKFENPLYGYENFIYVNHKTKGNITCYIHGDFEQTPRVHINHKCGCPSCRFNVSKPEIKWLDSLGIEEKYRQAVIHIDKKWIKVDAFIPETNTIYEYHGDFWHGGNKYDGNYIHPIRKIPMAEIRKMSDERDQLIKSLGYNLIITWQSEFICK